MDYGGIYDQPQNDSFCEEKESVQYPAKLAMTDAIKVLFVKRFIKNYL